MMKSDVTEPHGVSHEPYAHYFGINRSMDRERTVKIWGDIARKLHERFRLIHKNGLQREREQKKGMPI